MREIQNKQNHSRTDLFYKVYCVELIQNAPDGSLYQITLQDASTSWQHFILNDNYINADVRYDE